MIEKTVYVANDGTEFEEEEKCLEYEATTEYSDILCAVDFYSENGEIIPSSNDINQFNRAYDDALFIVIPSSSKLKDEKIKKFSEEVMYELYGKVFPTTTGIYRWDAWDDEFISFEADSQELNEKWDVLLNIFIHTERRH